MLYLRQDIGKFQKNSERLQSVLRIRESRVKKAPDPESGSAKKNLSILNQKNLNQDLSWDLVFFYPGSSRIQGTKSTGSRIRNNEKMMNNSFKDLLMSCSSTAGLHQFLVR
jgi:hypothetical protein